jgi:hypothetical protein
LLLKDRLSTRELLSRNMELPSYNCVLWGENVEESAFHLFIDCSFASDAWNTLQLQTNLLLGPIQNLESERPNWQTILYGDHHSNVLGDLDMQK